MSARGPDGQAMPLPVTLVTGFLGAGKTTLLRHVLAGDHGRRLGVVVNDFGAIGIDAELVREVHGETQTVRLTNGCICCSVRGDLLETVVQLGAQPDPPERVLVEASGVSDPYPIAAGFALPELAAIVRLDGIVAVLDAEAHGDAPTPAQALVRHQIEAADLVLLNKRDLAPAARREALRGEIARLSPQARVLETERCRIPADVLFGPVSRMQRAGAASRDAAHRHADHGTVFESFSWQGSAPMDAERLRDAIPYFPRSVLRGKGFVHTLQAPHEAGEFHLVGRRASLTRSRRWSGTPCTRLEFVGERDPGAAAAVARLLEMACVSRS